MENYQKMEKIGEGKLHLFSPVLPPRPHLAQLD